MNEPTSTMPRIFITSPNWHLSSALLHALQELPHPNRTLHIVDWGSEPPKDYDPKQDKWIGVCGDTERFSDWPENARTLCRKALSVELLPIFTHANLTGTHCQIEAALKTWLDETEDVS